MAVVSTVMIAVGAVVEYNSATGLDSLKYGVVQDCWNIGDGFTWNTLENRSRFQLTVRVVYPGKFLSWL